MEYDFDKIIDRRQAKYSYSMKWSLSPLVAKMVGMESIPDNSLAVFTADMDFRCAEPIIRAMHEVAEHGIFGYSLQQSTPEYNDSIIRWFHRRRQWKIEKEEIVYVNGTVEGIRQVIKAVTEPGDGVIIQRPVYSPFTSAIEYMGRQVINNSLLEKRRGYYEMDFSDLEEKAKDPKNKLFLLCNPHNPVGRIWAEKDLIRLAEICRRNEVIIFADEIHGDLIRRGEVFRPICTLVNTDNIIAATAVNKTFNLAGLHGTNLIIPNSKLREKVRKSLPFIMPTPFTIAATIAAYNEGEEWLEQLIDYLDDNIDFFISYLKQKMPRAKCSRPEGTYILWIDLRDYGYGLEERHHRIYEQAGVILESGEMFDQKLGKGFERICVPSPRAILRQAIDRMADAMEKEE